MNKVTSALFDPTIFSASILYVPTSLSCTSDIVNECSLAENMYFLVLLGNSSTLN